jgi:hypothetical protein
VRASGWGCAKSEKKCGEIFKAHRIVLLCTELPLECHLEIELPFVWSFTPFSGRNSIVTPFTRLMLYMSEISGPCFSPLLRSRAEVSVGREGRGSSKRMLWPAMKGWRQRRGCKRKGGSQMSTSTLLSDPPVKMHRSGHH